MSLTRRSFLGALGAGSAAAALPFITARGMEPVSAGYRELVSSRPNPLGLPDIRLDSNENPYGPAPPALEAIQGMFSEACRYPDVSNERLISAIAQHLKVEDANILLGQGSSEILRVAVDTFTGPTRGLVTASPTFELPTNRARVLGVPVVETALAPGLLLDLDRMTDASASAGLVFLCNPNNPTATMHGPAAVKAALDRMLAASGDSVILVDEAYFEYVTRADHETMIPLALANPRIVVARTFSKVYGMAGLRVGYAVGQPATLALMARNVLVNNINVLAAAAAWTSLSVPGHAARQQATNTEVKGTTVRFFESRGYQVVPSEANFIMVDIRQPMQDFRQACQDRGVMVGRPFPPFDTHVRISIGTSEEMRQATEVFGQILQG